MTFQFEILFDFPFGISFSKNQYDFKIKYNTKLDEYL